MPTVNIPAGVRFALYVLTAIGTPVVAYLATQGVIGEPEQVLWAAEVTVVLALAASKTSLKGDERSLESPHDYDDAA